MPKFLTNLKITSLGSYSIVLLLLLIPLYPKFPLLGVSGSFVAIRLEDLVIGLLTAVLLVTSYRRRAWPPSPLPPAILLYWAISLLASFSGVFLTKTADPALAFLHTARRIEYLVTFFFSFVWLNQLADLKLITRVIIVISALVAFYGLGQQFLGFPVVTTTNSEFSKGLSLKLGEGARINSTFAGHYDLAAFVVFPLLLIIALLPLTASPFFLLSVWGVVYWTLLLSASRITFVSFFVGAVTLLLLMRKRAWIIPLGLVTFVGILVSPQLRGRYLNFITNHLSLVTTVSAQATPSALPDALKPPPTPEDRSFNIRLKAEWPRAVRSIIKNPILGTGFSSVGLATDNDYLRALAESGLLGFASFVLILLLFYKSIWKVIVAYEPDLPHAFILAVACSVFSLLLNALFIDIFAASKIAIFSWMLMGLAAKAVTLLPAEGSKEGIIETNHRIIRR